MPVSIFGHPSGSRSNPGGHRALVPTGVSIAIPPGYAGFIQPRSGLALRHGVTCLNTPGLIDAGYRGELKVLLINTDPGEAFTIERGDRIAQLVIQAVEHATFTEVDTLAETERGEGGFGHTGLDRDQGELSAQLRPSADRIPQRMQDVEVHGAGRYRQQHHQHDHGDRGEPVRIESQGGTPSDAGDHGLDDRPGQRARRRGAAAGRRFSNASDAEKIPPRRSSFPGATSSSPSATCAPPMGDIMRFSGTSPLATDRA